jgi:hypothetical protein
LGSHNNPVDTATGYGLDCKKSVLIPGRGKRFFSSQQRQDRLLGIPNFVSNAHRRLFPLGKVAGAWSWPNSDSLAIQQLYRLNYSSFHWYKGLSRPVHETIVNSLTVRRICTRNVMSYAKFIILHNVQTDSEAQPVSYLIGITGCFPGAKAAGAWSWLTTFI